MLYGSSTIILWYACNETVPKQYLTGKKNISIDLLTIICNNMNKYNDICNKPQSKSGRSYSKHICMEYTLDFLQLHQWVHLMCNPILEQHRHYEFYIQIISFSPCLNLIQIEEPEKKRQAFIKMWERLFSSFKDDTSINNFQLWSKFASSNYIHFNKVPNVIGDM